MRTDAFDVLGAGLSRLRASVPLLLAVPTLLLYWVAGAPLASFPTPWWTWVVLGGALVGSLLYLVLGYFSGRSATPAESHRRNFDDLRSHQDALEETLEILGEPTKQSPISQLALKKAGGSLTTVQAALGDARPGEGWATGESYCSAWVELHRAEEQLLLVRDPAAVIAEAEMDVQRLVGSRIPKGERDAFQKKLEDAIKVLRSESEGAPTSEQLEARERIRTVRQAINEYRDDRYDGLVRLGISLRRWRLMLGFVVYALFVMAIIAVDPGRHLGLVESFAVYYVVGAGAGIMNEIWKRRRTRPEVDDYGVTHARFLLVPALSGSAACAGVFLFGLVADSSLLDLVKVPVTVDYSRMSLLTTPALAVVAAIFGLAPGRLFAALDTHADALTNDIGASEAAGSSDASDKDKED
jgi:hypothetical protein